MKARGSECKDDNAAFVKRIMPGRAWIAMLWQVIKFAITPILTDTESQKAA
jgi:hypothetical protein